MNIRVPTFQPTTNPWTIPEPPRGAVAKHAGYLNQPRGMRNPSAVRGMENGGGPHKKTNSRGVRGSV